MVLNDIDFEGGERNVCRDCVDALWGGGGGWQVIEIEKGGRQQCVQDGWIRGGRGRSGRCSAWGWW